jgi:hypothetical protein
MRTRYKIHNKGCEHPYFVTSTIVAWTPVFTHKDHFEILPGSLQYCREGKGIRLYAYVIMENHTYLIASSLDFLTQINNGPHLEDLEGRKMLEHLRRITYSTTDPGFHFLETLSGILHRAQPQVDAASLGL